MPKPKTTPPAADWLDGLPSFDADGLSTLGAPDLMQAYSQSAGLDDDRTHRSRPARIDGRRQLQLARAAEAIDNLPQPGECLHLVVKGNVDFYGYLDAIISKHRPATVERLSVSTLSFSKANAAALLDLLDDGTVQRLDLVCSCYFKAQDEDIFAVMANGLAERPGKGRILAARTHAKVICLPIAGQSYTLVGSANLRACRNIECTVLSNDAGLLEFHRQWIDDLLDHER